MKCLALATSLLAFLATTALAGPVEQRQAIMKANGQAMAVLASMARGERDFDPSVAQDALGQIGSNAGKLDVAAHFPAGTDQGDTEAAPRIWEDMDGFSAAVDEWQSATAELAGAPAQSLEELRAQMATLGRTCSGCHEDFRIKKQ